MTVENINTAPTSTLQSGLTQPTNGQSTDDISASSSFSAALGVQLDALAETSAKPIAPVALPVGAVALSLDGQQQQAIATPPVADITPAPPLINPAIVEVTQGVESGKNLPPQTAQKNIDQAAQAALDDVLQYFKPSAAVSNDKKISDKLSSQLDSLEQKGDENNDLTAQLAGADIPLPPQVLAQVLPQTIVSFEAPKIKLGASGLPEANTPIATSIATTADGDADAGKIAQALLNPSANGDNSNLADNQDKTTGAPVFKTLLTQVSTDDNKVDNTVVPTNNVTVDQASFPTLKANISPAELGVVDKPVIAKELGHPEWGSELGERILWLHGKSISSAEIQLNPEHLGPITIKIDVDQDQTNIAFTAQHANVREALEASIPKLRELFNNQQLNLTNVNVSQHNSPDPGRQQNFNQHGKGQAGTAAAIINATADITEDTSSVRAYTSKGVLSLYA
ncbi:MAG: flagellar hook-length control protein FliK [Methylococcaceae bacterium]|jgi:flagellar hook-length control protein FliK